MKTEKWIKLGIIMSVIIFAIAACGKSKYPGFKKTENGVYLKYHKKGAESAKPEVGAIVTVDMVYGLGDTILFESSKMAEPVSFPVLKSMFEGDLYAALTLLNVGDSVTIAFPADSFFMVMAGMPKSPDYVKPNATLYFDLKLRSFVSEEESKAKQKAELAEMKQKEQDALQNYLLQNKITTPPLASGLYYIEEKKGAGPLPVAGDVLKVHFSVSMIDGIVLFSSFEQEPMDIEFGQPFDTKGFDEGLGYLRKGAKAKMIVPSSLAFDSLGRSQMIPPYSTIIYVAELVSIKPKAEVDREREAKRKLDEIANQKAMGNEQSNLNNYLKTNNITIALTASGLYYVETQKGTGAKIENGNEVKVHYTLYNIEGKKLQSSLDGGQPFALTVGQGQVIKGWDEGLLLMNIGGKAKLILPSSLAYGGTARSEDIPAYSPLVFEIEVLELVKK